MKTMDENGGREFLDHLLAFDTHNEQLLLALFCAFGVPDHLLDLGCGTGIMVRLASMMGVDAYGVDVFPSVPNIAPPLYLRQDLTEIFHAGNKEYEMITCIEVAEHLPLSGIDTFIQNVKRHLAHRGRFVFSAAHPGQGGEQHVTLKPSYWWRTKFADAGITYLERDTHKIATIMMMLDLPMMWIPNNIQIFDCWK